MEPPVSDPVAAKQSPAATEDADPPEDPPGTKSLSLFFDFNGFITLPKKLVVLAEPIANSSIFVLPKRTAPEFHKF